jgi:ABC-type lipoprotein release transport system permease subunit
VRTLYAPNENDRTIAFAKPPAEVAKLDQVRGLPRVLGIFLAALAGLAILHALVQTAQRRRVELGVLRAIGFTRGQVAGSMGWQAVTLAVVGAAVGLPVGIAAGRWVWAAVANGLGVAPQPAVAGPLLLVVPAAIAIAALAGTATGALAGRSPASVALRAE